MSFSDAGDGPSGLAPLPGAKAAAAGGDKDDESDEAEEEEDREELVDRAQCKTLQISYRLPAQAQGGQRTEDVYLDPRDAWRATAYGADHAGGAGDNLLLVSSQSVVALQQQSDQQSDYMASTKLTMDACRRDYLREQQRLLEELDIMRRRLPPKQKQAEEEIRLLRASVHELYDTAVEGGDAVVGKDEAEAIADTYGPPGEPDPDALRILLASGFKDADYFTVRILLKRFLMASADLMDERERLRVVLEGLEAETSGAGLFDAMVAAMQGSNTQILEVLQGLLELTTEADQRKKIEDKATNGIRHTYDRLVNLRADIEPQVVAWRDTLKVHRQKTAQAKEVRHEEQDLEEQLETKVQKEEAMVEDWERRRMERYERRKLKKEEKEAERQRKLALVNDPNADIDIKEYLTDEERSRLLQEQRAVQAQYRRAKASEERAEELEQEMLAMDEAKEEARQRVVAAQGKREDYEHDIVRVQDKMEATEQATSEAMTVLKKLKIDREDLEDEYKAATMPPPKEKDLTNLEREVEAAKEKNQELRDEEDRLWGRVELYEQRWERTQNAWLAKKEEELAAEFYAKLAAEEAAEAAGRAKPPRPRPSDPLMVAYYERVMLPEYQKMKRHKVLHTDDVARDKQRRQRQQVAADIEGQRVLAQMRSDGFEGEAACSSSSPPRTRPPLTFFRSQDLKVKLRGTERNAASLADAIALHQDRLEAARHTLAAFGPRANVGAAAVGQTYGQVADRLASAFEASSPEDQEAHDALQLALHQHSAALSTTEEAWHLAELGCERGAQEARLAQEAEACVAREAELTEATERLVAAANAHGDYGLEEAGRWAATTSGVLAMRLESVQEARTAMWPEVLAAADDLAQAHQAQEELQTLLKQQEHKRVLLEAEVTAPAPDVRRAVAALRGEGDPPGGAGGGPQPMQRRRCRSKAEPDFRAEGRSQSPPLLR